MATDGGTPTERELARAARAGEFAEWPDEDERTVSAAFVRELLLDPATHPKGVRLRRVHVTGKLDLDHTETRVPLVLQECRLGDLWLQAASMPTLVVVGCHAGTFTGDGLRVTGGALNLEGTTFTGPVSLLCAQIDGGLFAAGMTVDGADEDGESLVADSLRVHGNVMLLGLTTRGSVNLTNAAISGQVDLGGARLNGHDTDGYSLFADRLSAGGGLLLGAGFVAAGAVRLLHAEVAVLQCSGARLLGSDAAGHALAADHSTTEGVLLDDGFECAGGVRLLAATITGNVQINDARVTGSDTDGRAVLADGATIRCIFVSGSTVSGGLALSGATVTGQVGIRRSHVGHDVRGDSLYAVGMAVANEVLLDDGTAFAGAVRLDAATVGGNLVVQTAALGTGVALSARRATVGTLEWHPVHPVEGGVTLQGARVGILTDDWSLERAHWPPPGRLTLTGLTYDVLAGNATWRDRLAWLRLQHGGGGAFATQPYSELVRAYRAAGQDDDARNIAIARHDDLREHGGLSKPRRFGNWFLGATIRHGYKPGRAILFLLGTYVVLTLWFWYGQHRPGQFVPRGTAPAPADAALHCRATHPCFYPWLYALDVVVPILDVKDGDAWRPDARADLGWAFVGATVLGTGIGWGATTLAVVGFTNVVRKE